MRECLLDLLLECDDLALLLIRNPAMLLIIQDHLQLDLVHLSGRPVEWEQLLALQLRRHLAHDLLGHGIELVLALLQGLELLDQLSLLVLILADLEDELVLIQQLLMDSLLKNL